jgi:hypothetical protein
MQHTLPAAALNVRVKQDIFEAPPALMLVPDVGSQLCLSIWARVEEIKRCLCQRA